MVCAALIGASLGFLWFNCHPAQVFMGDTGSLAIGGLIGAIAVMIKQELVLVIVGGIFVMEAASVADAGRQLQAARRRNVFLRTPDSSSFRTSRLDGDQDHHAVLGVVGDFRVAGIGNAEIEVRKP